MTISAFTHFNAAGEAHMVDVGEKKFTARIAITEGFIVLQPATLALILLGGHKKVMYLVLHALQALWRASGQRT